MTRGRRLSHPLTLCCLMLASASLSFSAEKFECLVEPKARVNVSSPLAGILDEVTVDRGDRVKKGQVLARLKSDVEQAHFELVKARAEFAARRAERNEELYLKQMISSEEKDELETNAQLLQLEVREAQKRLEQRTIRSPLKGVVVERFYSPGEYVFESAIYELAQTHPLRVEVSIPIEYYGRVKVGMKGRVEWEAQVSSAKTATVTVVDPVIDAASGTIGVRLELPNPSGTLPAGTRCSVEFPLDG